LTSFALLRSAKPCSLSRFLKNRQTFFAFNIFFIRIPQPSLQAAEAVSAEPCSLARLLKSTQTFQLFLHFQPASFRNPQLPPQAAEAVSAKPSIMHRFFKPRQLSKTFFTANNQHPKEHQPHRTPVAFSSEAHEYMTDSRASSTSKNFFAQVPRHLLKDYALT
jgi:hypothetical protein